MFRFFHIHLFIFILFYFWCFNKRLISFISMLFMVISCVLFLFFVFVLFFFILFNFFSTFYFLSIHCSKCIMTVSKVCACIKFPKQIFILIALNVRFLLFERLSGIRAKLEEYPPKFQRAIYYNAWRSVLGAGVKFALLTAQWIYHLEYLVSRGGNDLTWGARAQRAGSRETYENRCYLADCSSFSPSEGYNWLKRTK